MPERLPAAVAEKLTQRLTYYEDLGIKLFYRTRDRGTSNSAWVPASMPTGNHEAFHSSVLSTDTPVRASANMPSSICEAQAPSASTSSSIEDALPTISAKPIVPATPRVTVAAPQKIEILPKAPEVSLFDAANRIPDDNLLRVREDLGDCTRCKLHRTRKTIVFADGNPKAELVFVGEGPGHDEDVQGLPFVGRAGKLLNQMIEAMGLQRKDVYICNVVKCRPPENRLPERDEIECCSPFLLRQLDVISPKVIICLGACSAQTLLQTNRGISHFRGQWLEFRGHRLMATYHPAYLLRNPAAKSEVWKDLQKVMSVLGLEGKKNKAAESGKHS
jgi:uracil-DNA glycosylase family 4